MAALHACDANPTLDVTVVVKGLVAQSGCTRMVQGGYNAVLDPRDSFALHFGDTVRGGGFLNDQELAWTLVHEAPLRLIELENRYGCFFDRHPDGVIHQKPFAGQSFDRTVHRGDLTGIEIMGRLKDQLFARRVRRLEEHRALELVPTPRGRTPWPGRCSWTCARGGRSWSGPGRSCSPPGAGPPCTRSPRPPWRRPGTGWPWPGGRGPA